MKTKNLLIFIALLVATNSLFAQFGLHAGMSVGSMRFSFDDDGGTETEKFKSKFGFTVGGFYRHQLSAQFAIQPELNFVQRGGSFKEDLFEEEFSTDLTFNYLEIPIHFLYTSSEFEGFYAGGGPSFNFGLGGKVNASFAGESESESIDFGSDGDFKGFMFGANIVAGYQFLNGLNASAFFTQGLSNIATQEAIDEDNSKVILSNFGLRIGYTFGGGGMAKAKNGLKTVL